MERFELAHVLLPGAGVAHFIIYVVMYALIYLLALGAWGSQLRAVETVVEIYYTGFCPFTSTRDAVSQRMS
jgi:hypothetical protein